MIDCYRDYEGALERLAKLLIHVVLGSGDDDDAVDDGHDDGG